MCESGIVWVWQPSLIVSFVSVWVGVGLIVWECVGVIVWDCLGVIVWVKVGVCGSDFVGESSVWV